MATREDRKEERKKDNQKYLKEHCDEIMRRMVLDILKAKPADVLEYMANWIARERGVAPPTSSDHNLPLGDGKIGGSASPSKNNTHRHKPVESEDDEEEDHEEIAALERKAAQKKGDRASNRTSVSAEVYGMYNPKKAFVPKVIKKSEESKKKIYDKLNKNFMFKSLDNDNKEIVINAMQECKFE